MILRGWETGKIFKIKFSCSKFGGGEKGEAQNPVIKDLELEGEKHLEISKAGREREKEVGPGVKREALPEGNEVRNRESMRKKWNEK